MKEVAGTEISRRRFFALAGAEGFQSGVIGVGQTRSNEIGTLHWIVSLLCSQPTDAGTARASSSFLCGSWRCILPLRKFTLHPYESMARVPARAIAVSGVQ